MIDDKTVPENTIAGRRKGLLHRYLFVVVESILYSIGIFFFIDAALLRTENVSSMSDTLQVVFAFVILFFVCRGIYSKMFDSPLFRDLAEELSLLFVVTTGLTWLSLRKPSYINLDWLPVRWHRLPDMFFMFLKIDPWIAVAAFVVFLLCGYSVVSGKFAAVLKCAIFTVVLVISWPLQFPSFEYRLLFLLFAAVVLLRTRLLMRSLLICIIAVVFYFYGMGILPICWTEPPVDSVSKINLPVRNEFISSLATGADGNYLYAAGGRAGTVFIIDKDKKKCKEKRIFPGANFVDIAFNPPSGKLYALDRNNQTLLEFEGGTLAGVNTHKITTDWGFAARQVIPLDDMLYVTFSEYPGIAEYSMKDFSQEGGLQLNGLGTPFRSGMWGMAPFPGGGELYVISGAAGKSAYTSFLRVDLMRFMVSAALMIPDLCSGVRVVESEHRAYTASSYGNRIYEIGLDNMKLLRSFPGPVAAGSIEYDPMRNYLYAGGRYDGKLNVIDIPSGKTISSKRICARITDMKIDEKRDVLWVSCSKGIFGVALKNYLSSPVK